MARAVAIALIALVAVCLVADASAAFCRTSSYKLDGATVRNNKADMFKNCGAKVEVVSSKQVGDCFVFVQRVANEAAWNKYSDCEKSDANAKLYKPLKDNSKACEGQQKKSDC